jgi:hypothetical protein
VELTSGSEVIQEVEKPFLEALTEDGGVVSENFSVNELPAGGVEEQQGFVAHLDESVREATRP